MEAIILGNYTDIPIGSAIPVSVPAYEAEQAVIKLSDGYNPYIIGSGSTGTSITIQNSTVKVFSVSNAITTQLTVDGTINNIVILTVNGLEYYINLDFTFSGAIITFIDVLPYDSTFGNTTVKVIYNTLSTSQNLTALALLSPATLISLDTTTFDNNLDSTVVNVQLLAEAVDELVGGGGTTDHSLLTNLSYATSGHTGFAPALGVDDNYVTDAEKIVIGNTSNVNTGDQDLSGKQNVLISGTNIKTINSTSLLGTGDIVVSSDTSSDQSILAIQIFS
jgi:hypothetical protein